MVLYSGGRYGSGNAGDEIKAQSCDLDIRDVQGDSFCVSQLSCDPIDFVFNAGRAGLIFLGGHTAVPNSIDYIIVLWSTRRLTLLWRVHRYWQQKHRVNQNSQEDK